MQTTLLVLATLELLSESVIVENNSRDAYGDLDSRSFKEAKTIVDKGYEWIRQQEAKGNEKFKNAIDASRRFAARYIVAWETRGVRDILQPARKT